MTRTLCLLVLASSLLVACGGGPLPGAPTAAPGTVVATPGAAGTQLTESAPTTTPVPATQAATAPVTAPTAAAPSPTAPKSSTSIFSIESGHVTFDFWLYQPSSYVKGKPIPLVINFHGFDSDAPGEQALSGMTPKAEAEGFIVVYPNGLQHAWRDGPQSADVQFTRDLITQLEMVYSIDPKRIYVTGMSNGGGMANRVGCELPDIVAAIGPVAGAYNLWKQCRPSRPMPVVAFHGLADNVVPYEGAGRGNLAPPIHEWAAAWADRDGCSATPTITLQTTDVTGETWGNCSQGAEVVLYSIANHGHSWPGSAFLPAITSQAINATDVMWEFFKAHPLP